VREQGGSTAGQIAKLSYGNTPHHRPHAQFVKEGWPWAGNPFFYPLFHDLKSSPVQELKLFQEFSLFWEFHKMHEIHKFQVPRLLFGDWRCTGSLGGEKNCIMYSLFCIVFIIIFIIVVVSISISTVVF